MRTDLRERLERVRAAITAAECEAGRNPGSVRLLGVSKRHPAEAIRTLAQAGLNEFGESYLQEALAKIEQLRDLDLCWHFIGPIQSNKTRPIAEHFAWAHSVDRLKIAERLSAQRPAEMAPLNLCLQVNLDAEPTKSGVAPEAVAELAGAVAALPRLRLRGLMAIPRAEDDFTRQRATFARLRELQTRLNEDGLALDTLSMGMSDDLRAAVCEGSTLVRVGSALFGART